MFDVESGVCVICGNFLITLKSAMADDVESSVCVSVGNILIAPYFKKWHKCH
jgi:hypothetical protein